MACRGNGGAGTCGWVLRTGFVMLAAASWSHTSFADGNAGGGGRDEARANNVQDQDVSPSKDVSRIDRDADSSLNDYPEMTAGPFFLGVGNRNITTTVGQTAYLHCRVSQLGDLAQVSWIRKRDLHVMSSGMVVFASDQRFQVIHPDKSENWTLQIRFAQLRDAGIYECQVNTEPKMYMSYALSVVESRATIVGPEYVKAGSTINLTCIINEVNMQGLVYWYHNNDMLDYEGPVWITTREEKDATTSHLVIREASPKDSGNYTC